MQRKTNQPTASPTLLDQICPQIHLRTTAGPPSARAFLGVQTESTVHHFIHGWSTHFIIHHFAMLHNDRTDFHGKKFKTVSILSPSLRLHWGIRLKAQHSTRSEIFRITSSCYNPSSWTNQRRTWKKIKNRAVRDCISNHSA